MYQNGSVPRSKTNQMSGNTYVSASYRYPEPGDDTKHLARIPVRPDTRCDHMSSMCLRWSCIESWTLDYVFYLNRTGAGRRIAAQFNLDPNLDIRPQGGIDRISEPAQA